jgi:hypothetical protein
MAEVWVLAVSFPSVVYTVLLGVVLVYWAFVMVGAIDLGEGGIDGLDIGGHVGGDVGGDFGGDVGDVGDLAGTAKGALEGAAKGALEAHFSGDSPDLDGHEAGIVAALMSALRLRQVPATLVLSVLVTFSWLASVVAMQFTTRAGLGSSSLLGVGVLLLSPLAAMPLTALLVRPLAGVFAHRHAPSRADLIGKTCIVRTGKVTEAFGEGTLEDGGAGLVVSVRIDGGRALRRGDHALIVEWDVGREAFLVEPMTQIMSGRRAADEPEK